MSRFYTQAEPILTWVKEQRVAICHSLGKDNLWKRMSRNVVATTLTAGVCLIHYEKYNPPFGKAAYIAAMLSVFVHPGRRVGQLVEALTLAVFGAFLGIAWGLLGLYLSSLIKDQNPSAAFSIRGIFFAIALMIHGFLRSHAPRVFLFVLFIVIECLSVLTGTAVYVTPSQVQQLSYPVLLAAAIILTVNIFVLPEFSSAFLGQTTIDALDNASIVLAKSGQYFVETAELDSSAISAGQEQFTTYLQHSLGKTPPSMNGKSVSLAELTAAKSGLRQKISTCRNAQNECQFEIAYSHLPPYAMSPISKKAMKKLTRHVVSVIGTCETRFALLGKKSLLGTNDPVYDMQTKSAADQGIPKSGSKGTNLELLKPKREIEFGDAKLFNYLLRGIREPYMDLQSVLLQSVDVVVACLAFAYDVPQLPSKARSPTGITTEELDLHYSKMELALKKFDDESTVALDRAAVLQDLNGEELDFMPREEIFLIASFLLNVRQAATQIHEMLRLTKALVQRRSESAKLKRLYLPRIHWKKWIYSGGENDESMSTTGIRAEKRKPTKIQETNPVFYNDDYSNFDGRVNHDVEIRPGRGKTYSAGSDADSAVQKNPPIVDHSRHTDDQYNLALRMRGKAADLLEWVQQSEDLSYAFKLTIATFIVAFPAFVPSLNYFYYRWRGAWAALQLIFVFDVAIGTSINNFFIRAVGTTLGSLWGWAAYEARAGNAVVCTAMIFVGLIPFNYVLLGTKYSKTGTVSLISLCVVAMATELQTVPGTGTENFVNRWLAFLVGGSVALIVEILLLPVKARTRMVNALAAAIKHIGRMESCVAYGVENGIDLVGGFPSTVFERFDQAGNKANAALASAETFFPFCGREPRLKGAWSNISTIFEEIIFVLHQIIDKMDNMVQLRLSFGSGPLEEFNAQIFQYRRNVAGAISLVLYAVHEALTIKYPLPQFVPSARLAHLRMINKIREVIRDSVTTAGSEKGSNKAQRLVMRRKYLSWSASAAAQAEVIEYLEELTDLAKLLVGANEFSSGVLHRLTFQHKLMEIGIVNSEKSGEEQRPEDRLGDKPLTSEQAQKLTKSTDDDAVPLKLECIQTRKLEAKLKK